MHRMHSFSHPSPRISSVSLDGELDNSLPEFHELYTWEALVQANCRPAQQEKQIFIYMRHIYLYTLRVSMVFWALKAGSSQGPLRGRSSRLEGPVVCIGVVMTGHLYLYIQGPSKFPLRCAFCPCLRRNGGTSNNSRPRIFCG